MKVEKISITRDDVMLLLTMEAGGFNYWGRVDFKDDDYKAAKAEMKEKGLYSEHGTCYEDIVAYMIYDTDYPVYIVDDEEEETHRLTKEMIEKGFLQNLQERPEDGNLDEGDSTTGDCIMQYAIFGDIIYG